MTSSLLRLQHAICIGCAKQNFKQLIVALEWSENESALTEIFRWAEKTVTTVGSAVIIYFKTVLHSPNVTLLFL